MSIVRNNVEEIRDIQDTLVSGTNIKTVGGASLLGSGDIPQYTPPTNQGANNYLAGDGTYKQVVVPTNVSELTNDTGFITGVSWSEVTSKPSFATVATSGSYNDLSNKPTIPTVPTNVSSFTNDAGYVTSSGNTVIGTDADINTSGSTIIDNLYMTDGVITSHGTRTLTLGDLGYTGETNATADQSASEILTAIKTVDGSGSGLDADTVDGYNASTTRNAANTIPIRDGNGYLQLGWINTTSGNTTSTISDFYVNTNDGYIRKATKAHALSQLGALADSGKSLATSGYQKLSNGLIFQWRTFDVLSDRNNGPHYFPIAFPNACFNVNVTHTGGIANTDSYLGVYSVDSTKFYAGNGLNQNRTCYMFAIGY